MSRVTLSILITLCALWASACASLKKQTSEGLQSAFSSHVPARTAVLPCQVWRNVTLPVQDIKFLCDQMDEAVMEGFRGQPYMRGFSPKVVMKLADQAKWPSAVSEGLDIVLAPGNKPNCATTSQPMCTSSVEYYNRSLASNAAWHLWLARFSDTQRYADATLIPILLSATDVRRDDRGLISLERQVTFVLWLVDTSTGQLMWTRTKSGTATNRALPEKTRLLTRPEWKVAVKRALTQDFWQDYPGRLVLD